MRVLGWSGRTPPMEAESGFDYGLVVEGANFGREVLYCLTAFLSSVFLSVRSSWPPVADKADSVNCIIPARKRCSGRRRKGSISFRSSP